MMRSSETSCRCASDGCDRAPRLELYLGRPDSTNVKLCGFHFMILADWVNGLCERGAAVHDSEHGLALLSLMTGAGRAS